VLINGIERILCVQFVEYIELSLVVFCHVFSRVSEDFTVRPATALTSVMDDIHLSVEKSGFSVAVLVDFSKALDSMVHGMLLRKLRLIIINDECEQILNCKFHSHADDFQLYTVDLRGDVDTLVRIVNEDLEMIRRWSVDNSLVLNVSKTR
jgi:hypothetical protein